MSNAAGVKKSTDREGVKTKCRTKVNLGVFIDHLESTSLYEVDILQQNGYDTRPVCEAQHREMRERVGVWVCVGQVHMGCVDDDYNQPPL